MPPEVPEYRLSDWLMDDGRRVWLATDKEPRTAVDAAVHARGIGWQPEMAVLSARQGGSVSERGGLPSYVDLRRAAVEGALVAPSDVPCQQVAPDGRAREIVSAGWRDV